MTGSPDAIACFTPGGPAARALVLALAGAGHRIGLATLTAARDEEFATASIANELWALGTHHLHRPLPAAADPAAVAAFAAELDDRLGPVRACLIHPGPLPPVPFDEFSLDEWQPLLARHLAAPLVIAHALAPIIERNGGGPIIFAVPPAPDAGPAGALRAALAALPAALAAATAGRPLRFAAIPEDSPPDLLAAR